MAIKKQIRVLKFGGTSVGNTECLRRAADILSTSVKSRATVAVVSAMSGMTNAILKAGDQAAQGQQLAGLQLADMLQCRHSSIAHALVSDEAERRELQGEIKILTGAAARICEEIAALGSANARLTDALCSIGERLSTRLFAAALTERGIPALAVDATTLLVTSDIHGDAEPDLAATRARVRTTLRPLIGAGIVPVITGFIGATLDGIPTTLGRGGSDYSATIVAASLDAESVTIFTDVDGVMTADPKLVPGAQTISEMSYGEATAFAQAGAKVIHPKTLRPVAAAGIPVQIRNSFNPKVAGTWVTNTPQTTRGSVIGIAARTDQTAGVVTLLAEQLSVATANQIRDRIDLALTAASIGYQFEGRGALISLTVSTSDLASCVQILHDEFDLSIGRAQNPEVASRLREITATAFEVRSESSVPATRRYNLALSPLP